MFSFEDIYGNEKIKKNLQTLIKNNNVSHAYIFLGQKGMGKKLISGTFIKTLQCEEEASKPCNNCISCQSFETSNHPDVIYVKPSKPSGISVDDVRGQINKVVNIKPFKYNYKIFVIENADSMNFQAQNAVLKTIEEPPSYGIFVLLAETIDNFLLTILSRCVIVKLQPVSLDTVKNYLVSVEKLNAKEAETYAIFSQGNIGLAKSILNNQDFKDMRLAIINIAMKIVSCEIQDVFIISKEFDAFKEKIQEALDILLFWYHDLAIFKETLEEKFIFQKDTLNLIKENINNFSLTSLLKKPKAVLNAKIQLRHNGNFQLVIETLLLELKEQ